MNKLFLIAVVIGVIALLRTADAGYKSLPPADLPKPSSRCDTVCTEYKPLCAVYRRTIKTFRDTCALKKYNIAYKTRYYKVKDGECKGKKSSE